MRLLFPREPEVELRVVVIHHVNQGCGAAVVEIGRVLEQRTKRSRSILASSAALRGQRLHAGLLGCMQAPASVAQCGAAVARSTARSAVEEAPATLRRTPIVGLRGRRGRLE